jgi:hypothetical protein
MALSVKVQEDIISRVFVGTIGLTKDYEKAAREEPELFSTPKEAYITALSDALILFGVTLIEQR